MKKKSHSNNTTSLHEMAVRLCEGGKVYYNGHFWTTKVVENVDNPCDICKVDYECCMPIFDLCTEVECYDHKRHILVMDGGA